MTPSNKATLDKHYHHWRTLRDAQYLRGLNIHEREDMVRVLREEFWPGYTYDGWCGSCVADMVRTLYTRYDKWLSEQPPPEPEPIIVAASFPVNDKPEIGQQIDPDRRGNSNTFVDTKGAGTEEDILKRERKNRRRK